MHREAHLFSAGCLAENIHGEAAYGAIRGNEVKRRRVVNAHTYHGRGDVWCRNGDVPHSQRKPRQRDDGPAYGFNPDQN